MGKIAKKIEWVLKNTTILGLLDDKKDEPREPAKDAKKKRWDWSK